MTCVTRAGVLASRTRVSTRYSAGSSSSGSVTVIFWTLRSVAAYLPLVGSRTMKTRLSVRGTTTPRTDKRVFMVLEPTNGKYAATLLNVQKITVTEPLLEEPAEYLVDTLVLDAKTPALVTHVIGYDADTFTIYTRAGASWKSIYTGGGAAMEHAGRHSPFDKLRMTEMWDTPRT